jgi:hypothetical protein
MDLRNQAQLVSRQAQRAKSRNGLGMVGMARFDHAKQNVRINQNKHYQRSG